MSNPTFHVRDLIHQSEVETWKMVQTYPLAQPIDIVFDDGTLTVNVRTTFISWYFWQLFKHYPNTPIVMRHHLQCHHFDSSAFNKLATIIIGDIRLSEDVDFNTMSVHVMDVLNTLYNSAVANLGDWVATIDATDYVEILYHPEVERQRQACIDKGTPSAISELYKNLPKTIEADDFLPHNAIKADVEMRNSKVNQVMQCVAVIGFRTDIDGHVFSDPIFSCYGTGLKNMAHVMMESRAASKALLAARDPITATEYFNRRMQLLDQSIVGMAYHLPKFEEDIRIRKMIPQATNCGTRDTLPWKIYPGNEKNVIGRYYYEVDPLEHRNAPLYCIETMEQAKALVNKNIFLRTPLMCDAKKDNCLCHICFGQLADTIPHMSNVGHIAAYVLGAIISQKTLSAKHYTASAEVIAIHLEPTDMKYIQLDPKRNELIYLYNKNMFGQVSLLMHMDDVGDLTQAMNADDVRELSIDKITSLTRVGIKQVTEDFEETEWVTVSDASRHSSLSYAMLEYIKKHNYTMSGSKCIEVSLKDWNFNDVAFQLPKKQLNTLDFMKRLAKMIEDGPKGIDKKGLDPSNPKDLSTFLKKVTKFAWSEISVPMVYLETTILSTLVENIEEHDYRISSNNYKRDFSSVADIIKNRSIGEGLTFEEQSNILVDGSSYDHERPRTPHTYDALFYSKPPYYLLQYPEYAKEFDKVWGNK